MAVEIEAKLKVVDHGPIRERLQSVGAALIGRVNELNVFFDTPDRAMLGRDEGLRLRTSRQIPGGGETHLITYKGPPRAGAIKSREEIELIANSAEDGARLLERLGFIRIRSFEKRRETWLLDGCHVELDEVPYLGTFVEIEGPDESAVSRVQGTLGLSDQPHVKPGYISMLMNYLQEHQLPATDVTFAGAAH